MVKTYIENEMANTQIVSIYLHLNYLFWYIQCSETKRTNKMFAFFFRIYLRSRFSAQDMSARILIVLSSIGSDKASTQQNSFSIFAAICVLVCARRLPVCNRMRLSLSFRAFIVHRKWTDRNFVSIGDDLEMNFSSFNFSKIYIQDFAGCMGMSGCTHADCAVGNLSRLLLCDNKSKQTEKHIHLQ